jgi:mannose-6-phosphate isomerase-like protein (cupin superfamily)
MAPPSLWSGNLRLSLVLIPVRLVPAVSTEEAISFRQIHEPSGTPIRQVKGVRDGDIFTDVRQHWHSANETHTMISGKATFACEGNRVELGPGGFNYMPARMVHEAWTTPGSVVFITVDGPWDVNWVEGPPTSADVIQ